jgi:spore maturation protein A
MRELQTLNPHKETATNAMAMFLAINTSSITIIPISIIALRVAAGSKNAAAPLGAILIGTVLSTVIAIVVVRWMQNRKRYELPTPHQPPGASPRLEPNE